MNRRIGFLASVGLVLWAAIVVPMPFFETLPGSAHPVEELITLSATTEDIQGDLDLLTVRQSTPNILEALWAAVHPDRELRPAVERTPTDVDLEDYLAVQAQAFDSAFTTAVALAAQQAGYDVTVRTSAVVGQVLPAGPSDGLLRAGDRITGIDGVAVDSGAALVDELARSDEPRDVALDIVRDERARTLTVALGPLPDISRIGLGIVVETVSTTPELPFDATLADSNIVGPSAGLMIALTATDLLLEEDLAHGRTIAGTGTIAGDGRVGRVGGIREKVSAAVDANADLLLVPIGQLEEAADAADGRIVVVGVATLQDAIDALRGTGMDVAAPR